MFTGIVEEVGSISALESLPGNAARIRVVGPLVVSDAVVGCSIAVSGACLTVTEFDDASFVAIDMTRNHVSTKAAVSG